MGSQFDWQFDEEEVHRGGYGRRPSTKTRYWLLIAIVLLALVGGWFFIQQRQERITNENINIAQEHVDLAYEAFHRGDGDLFFSLFDNDPAWYAAQLRPENLAFYRALSTPEITQAEAFENNIWANARWQDKDGLWQRIIFLRRQGLGWVRVPTDKDYWAQQLLDQQTWGLVRYYEVDEQWIPDIVRFVDDVVATICEDGCDRDQIKFTLDIRDDFTETAEPGQIYIPSPRLIGLDEAGEPSPTYWRLLRDQIEDRFAPATVRFAIPPPRSNLCCRNLDYEAAAEEFMGLHPNITLDLVALDALPDDLSSLASGFDGAAVPPTIDMVAAGEIYDLTDFAGSDPGFEASDFYEHVWQGAQWRGRMWFMPLTAEFRMLYYDKHSYVQAGITEPNLFWEWSDIDEKGSAVISARPEYSSLTWSFLDVTQNSLFAHAFSLANNCPDSISPPCLAPLQARHIAGALDWYKEMVASERTPDLTEESADDRQWIMNNRQSARRHAVIWVDEPILFEYYQLLDPVGIVPFPGVESMEGVTPLWVDGAFISAQSERPYATWQWLKFLSHQPPVKSYRLVPARPSVATATGFWRRLPRPLVDAMRTAYTFSRPVNLEEKLLFEWSDLSLVVSGSQTSQEIARQSPPINWFGSR